jgi:putative ABC transport system ATP-binding protein
VNPGAEIRAEALTKRYGRSGRPSAIGVADLTIDVPAGEVVAITGASGSGKSTLLHLVAGIERPDSGTVQVGNTVVTGLSVRRLPEFRRSVGLVFQHFHLLPALCALDNVVAPVLPYRRPYDKVARARELLGRVGLAEHERALPSELSGGEQQRVAIARALIGQPALLLADEPTGNLDSQSGSDVLDLLLQMRDEYGMTMLIATHSMQVAARCDRLIRLLDGTVVDDRKISAGVSADQTLRRIAGLSV